MFNTLLRPAHIVCTQTTFSSCLIEPPPTSGLQRSRGLATLIKFGGVGTDFSVLTIIFASIMPSRFYPPPAHSTKERAFRKRRIPASLQVLQAPSRTGSFKSFGGNFLYTKIGSKVHAAFFKLYRSSTWKFESCFKSIFAANFPRSMKNWCKSIRFSQA